MIRSIVLAVGAFILTAGSCLAADPAGDWVGTLRAYRGEETRLGMRVSAAPGGGYQATYEDFTHDYRGIPLTPAASGGAPGFRIKTPVGEFTASWDGAAGAWTGVWREKTGAYPISFAHGVIPPAPTVNSRDKVVLGVVGGLILAEGVAIARLLQLRRRRRLKAASAAA
jgi:hypothetical protein